MLYFVPTKTSFIGVDILTARDDEGNNKKEHGRPRAKYKKTGNKEIKNLKGTNQRRRGYQMQQARGFQSQWRGCRGDRKGGMLGHHDVETWRL